MGLTSTPGRSESDLLKIAIRPFEKCYTRTFAEQRKVSVSAGKAWFAEHSLTKPRSSKQISIYGHALSQSTFQNITFEAGVATP
jgi:hypothetical protein